MTDYPTEESLARARREFVESEAAQRAPRRKATLAIYAIAAQYDRERTRH